MTESRASRGHDRRRDGTATTYVYDEGNPVGPDQITSETVTGWDGRTRTTTRWYDALGRLEAVEGPGGGARQRV